LRARGRRAVPDERLRGGDGAHAAPARRRLDRRRVAHAPRADRAERPSAARRGADGRPGRAPLRFSGSRPQEANVQATDKIWMNGELVDWDDARVHVGAHGLHYGTGVFEGVRCYDTPQGPAIFRGGDHMQRLHDSAQLIGMEIPYSVDDLRGATND